MTNYGNTLDSLAANTLAAEHAAQQERNNYRNYLNNIANTNIRRTEAESNDRNRQGELGLRGREIDSNDRFRQGDLGIRGRDVDLRGKQADNDYAARIAALGEQTREFDMPYQKGHFMTPEQKALADANVALINAQARAATQPPKDVAVITASNANDQLKTERAAYATMRDQLGKNFSDQTSGLSWFKHQDPDTQAIQAIIATGVPYDTAVENHARKRFSAMYPDSILMQSAPSLPPTAITMPAAGNDLNYGFSPSQAAPTPYADSLNFRTNNVPVVAPQGPQMPTINLMDSLNAYRASQNKS